MVNKVMWVGRATVFTVGLVAIFALVFAAAYVTLGAGGDPDRTDGISQLVGSEVGADQALAVEPAAARRTPTQGYAHVTLSTATSPPTFDPARSRAVKTLTRAALRAIATPR